MWNIDFSEYDGTITTFCHIFVVVYISYQVLRMLFPLWAMRYESVANIFIKLWRSLKNKPRNRVVRNKYPFFGCFNYLLSTKAAEDKSYRWALYRALFAMVVFAVFPLYVATMETIPGLMYTYAYTLIFLGVGMVMSAVTRFRLTLVMNFVTRLVEEEQKQATESKQVVSSKKGKKKKG